MKKITIKKGNVWVPPMFWDHLIINIEDLPKYKKMGWIACKTKSKKQKENKNDV